MLRGFLCFGGALVALLAALTIILQKSGTVDVLGTFLPLPQVDEVYQRGFRSDAMVRINRIRTAAKIEDVRGDEEVQSFLSDFVNRHEAPADMDLQEVFDALQMRFPGAQYLAANLIVSRDRDDMLGKISGWNESVNSDFNTVNTAVFVDGRRMGVLGVMARRIPAFSLAAANAGGGRFHNRCPHCGEIHALDVEPESRTLILSCPYCDRPFDVLASDSGGRIRRASDFFDGFVIPETAAEKKLSGKRRIVSIWSQIGDRCDYRFDNEDSVAREVWRTSNETWADRAGDCEDTAILLADALVSAGFEARVAIGWNGNIGQHAWVVVRTDGEQFLLESTIQEKITLASLTPLEEAADFYQPEQLFDPERLYYTDARPERFTRDCFSSDVWRSVPGPADESEVARPQLSLR